MSVPRREAPEYDKVMTEREPEIIADIWDRSQGGGLRKGPESGLYPAFGYTHSWLCAPLVAKDRSIGVLRLDHRVPGYFAPQHASLTMAMANQAAIAIENARLHGRELELAALEAMNNVVRHAQATEVRLALSRKGGVMDLAIEDNGLGGTIEISSEPGAGTRVRARIPVKGLASGA